MIIKQEVLERIRGRSKVTEFAGFMGITFTSMYRWMKANEPDGPLTTMKALTWMSQQFSLDIEDLVEEKMEVAS